MTLTSCFKDDEPVVLPKAEHNLESFSMGENYEQAVYFDFSTKTAYYRDMYSWDLAFSFDEDEPAIHLNGGKGMYAAITEYKSFSKSIDISELKFKWDGSTGERDSTAMAGWDFGANKWHIYVIDRGPTHTDYDERFKKLLIYDYSDEYYVVYHCSISHGIGYAYTVCKYKDRNYSYFSFDDGGKCINLEPPRDDWDIVFTRGMHTFHENNPPLPYIVTTVLINPHKVWAAADSTTAFGDIDIAHADGLKYANNWDVIGWDWKEFDQDLGLYTVKQFKNYVVKDGEGNVFKLHFLDFYDKNRKRGNPKFEFTRLK